jgi:hypothetical protein
MHNSHPSKFPLKGRLKQPTAGEDLQIDGVTELQDDELEITM